jgi:gliding motility-associated-like protein
MPFEVNHYLSVSTVGTDRVQVDASPELSFFKEGDKVLLIQMTGATMNTDPGYLTELRNYIDSHRNVGMYEILQVDQVITGANNYVVFTDDVMHSYDAGERIQLVRIVEGENITVSGNVTAQPWDGYTGGIVAIIGTDSVIVDANIDASGAGFRGGIVPSENYTGICRKNPGTGTDTLCFLSTDLHRAGTKGEGLITVNPALWNYTRGAGAATNGGGGGNGMFSGGAGGGNWGQGGNGGRQSASCSDALVQAQAGLYIQEVYRNINGISMGGGGGTGVKNLPLYTATNGGNGGGIVMIITNVLKGKAGTVISVKGQSVSQLATGSGGGGGAAGTIILDATFYTGSLNVNIRGGNGGGTNGSVCTGTGGGGGGGLLWYSGAAITGVTPVVDKERGSFGDASGCFTYIGGAGNYGGELNNLILNLNGFLFNSIKGTDTLCAGQVPNKLTGTRPKGGDGTYGYVWEQSTNQVNWSGALGTVYRDSLRPAALNQTTYYRRIVDSWDNGGSHVFDTSKAIEVFVYPSISNNIIYGRDTICNSQSPKTLTGNIPAGGNGIYNYLWQSSTDNSTWAPGVNSPSCSPGLLTQSTYYRRVVTSTAYCSHTSNTVLVTVLPSIMSNVFETPDTVICSGFGPGLLNARHPAYGDGQYAYAWQSRSTTGSWTTVPGATGMRYNPGTLTDTVLYRRIVFSGNDKACKDTSLAKAIRVLPSITDNTLTSERVRYCSGEVPELISGTQPSGGDKAYTYQWYSSVTNVWQQIAGANGRDYQPPDPADTTIRFKREVISGPYHACKDTSVFLNLVVVPVIINSIDPSGQTICAMNTPAPLNGSPAAGGFGGFTYQWLQKEGNSAWDSAEGVSNQETYVPGPLSVSTTFARRVSSDICSQISNAVNIQVYPSISNNIILGDSIQYTCFNTAKSLPASQPALGSGSYAYAWVESDDNSAWNATSGNQQGFTSSPLATVRYFRRIVYSSPQAHECVDSSNVVEVRINPLPSGDVVSSKDTLCAKESLYVKFAAAGQHPPFSVSIGGQIKSGVTAALDSILLTPANPIAYTMGSITDDSMCVADPSQYTAEAMAVVKQVPDAKAGNDDEICGSNYTLHAVKSVTGSTGLWTSAGATFSDPSDPGAATVSETFGQREYTWTETNWHCSDNDQVLVIFDEQPGQPEAGADQSLDFNYTTLLEGSQPSVGRGKWTVISGSGVFDNDTLATSIVKELDVSNVLRWTVKNGTCPEVFDEMKIIINPLELPKGFSPNGDGKNDVFDLGAAHAESVKIKIYNSTGVLVFESDDYTNGNLWDGHNLNGVELPEGTYYYVADIKVAGREKEFQFRTFVEIIR